MYTEEKSLNNEAMALVADYYLFKINCWECVEMAAKPCNQPLKSNPFITYRDPITGKWIVVTQNLPTSAEYTKIP
jgi:hypothetical protein